MHRIFLLVFFLVSLSASAASPLAGHWRIDTARSTELSPWKAYDLVITGEGDHLTITRQFAAGRRTYEDVTPLDLTLAANVVPVTWWADNRHLGAYIGGDRTKKVRGEWLDDGRLLRLNTDLVLDTQQGARAVNILSDFKVSANGAQLTLTELRSTRNRPVVYIFHRLSEADAAKARATGNAE
jgi:hypothetical protein